MALLGGHTGTGALSVALLRGHTGTGACLWLCPEDTQAATATWEDPVVRMGFTEVRLRGQG